MVKLFAAALILFSGSISGAFAHAQDGEKRFVAHHEMVTCEGVDGDIVFDIWVDVQTKTNATALAMRVSDPNVAAARAEIAFFDFSEGALETMGPMIIGHVIPGLEGTSRVGERIGGTLLGALESVIVELDFDFSSMPVASKKHAAQAIYAKKNGEELVQDLVCHRRK